jgi:hypothetical protein
MFVANLALNNFHHIAIITMGADQLHFGSHVHHHNSPIFVRVRPKRVDELVPVVTSV